MDQARHRLVRRYAARHQATGAALDRGGVAAGTIDAATGCCPGRASGSAPPPSQRDADAGGGRIIMTPDTPLLFFWIAGVWALARLFSLGHPRWWLAAGWRRGLMLLSKYTALLFIWPWGAGLLALFQPHPPGSARPGHGSAIALALLVFAPNIAWNAAHGWASYLKQGGREDGFDPGPRRAGFLASWSAGRRCSHPAHRRVGVRGSGGCGAIPRPAPRLLLWLTLLPAAVLLEHVLTDRVQGNWVAILYPSACLAAAAAPPRWIRPALVLGFAVTALVYLQALAAPFPIPAATPPPCKWRAGGISPRRPPPRTPPSSPPTITPPPPPWPSTRQNPFRFSVFGFEPALELISTGPLPRQMAKPACSSPGARAHPARTSSAPSSANAATSR